MRSTLLRPVLVGSLLLGSLAAAGSATPAAAQDTQNVPADRHNDNGFDKGLLGLLGLAGLFGLKRRDDRDARYGNADRHDANRSTTSRV
jgi:MYXO-CTERM domain-containing protein